MLPVIVIDKRQRLVSVTQDTKENSVNQVNSVGPLVAVCTRKATFGYWNESSYNSWKNEDVHAANKSRSARRSDCSFTSHGAFLINNP